LAHEIKRLATPALGELGFNAFYAKASFHTERIIKLIFLFLCDTMEALIGAVTYSKSNMYQPISALFCLQATTLTCALYVRT